MFCKCIEYRCSERHVFYLWHEFRFLFNLLIFYYISIFSACKSGNSLMELWGRFQSINQSKSSFMLFLTEGDPSYEILLLDQKILFPAEVIPFWDLENTGNYVVCRTCTDLNHDFQKNDHFWNFKTYIFYPIILKHNLDVLGVN